MKNPKIYIVLVLLAILVLVFYFIKNKVNNKTEEQRVELKEKKALTDSAFYTLNPSESSVVWQAKKTFIVDSMDEGFISINSGEFETKNGEVTKGFVLVDMQSIRASKTAKGGGEDMLSGHLKSADFFDVENFPTSKFEITSIKKVSDIEYVLIGDLTIRNITKSIEAPMSFYELEGRAHIEGVLVVDRSLFEVKFGSKNFFKDLGDKTIDDNFTLKLNLIANK